jgi:hypothetical protein
VLNTNHQAICTPIQLIYWSGWVNYISSRFSTSNGRPYHKVLF